VGIILLDVITPDGHLREIRLGGVCREVALSLQTEPVRELSLGAPGDDPPTYPGPRIVGAVEAEPTPLLTRCEEPRGVSAAQCGVPPCLGYEVSSVFEAIPLQILRVPEP
jgi:hypothetical protein